MIDAYTIGITLALNNGVSEGLTAIRRDLDALDRSVGVVAGGLARLRLAAASFGTDTPGAGLAADLSRLAAAAQRVGNTNSVAQPEPLAATVEPSARANGAPPPPERASLIAAAPSAALAPPEQPFPSRNAPAPAAPGADRSVVALPDLLALGERLARLQPARPPQASPALDGSVVQAAVAQSSDTGAVDMPLTAPPVQPTHTAAVAPQMPVPVSPPVVIPQVAASVSPPARLASGPPIPLPSRSAAPPAADVPRRSDQWGQQQQVTPALSWPRGGPAVTSAAPAPMPPTPNLTASFPSVAPPPAVQHSGPGGGDVFLDGTKLGRWISDRLARDAGRPQSGTTGFEPRLSLAWPGAAIGS